MITLKRVFTAVLLATMFVAFPFSAMAHIPSPSGAPSPDGGSQVYEMHLPDAESLRSGAEAGNLEAQFELSKVYAWGDPQDFKAAEYWLRRAANADYLPAQYDLGVGLGFGSGATGRLPRDPVEGLMWLILAADQKPDQKWCVESLGHALRRQMKPEQIKEAECRAQEYNAKKSR